MKKIVKKIKQKIYDLENFYWVKKEILQRMIFWAKNMMYSYDFDAKTIYDMLYLKLDRVYNSMKNHGHCVWNSDINNPRMRELREARELARRLSDYNKYYKMRAYYETEEKYGKLKTWSEKIEGEDLFRYNMLWGGSEEIDKVARVYNRRRDKHWSKIYKDHKKRFHYLLEKNLDNWWD